MNDKITKIEFNIWANNENDGVEIAKGIGQIVDWYGQRGIKVTADQLNVALDKWRNNAFIRQGLMNYLK